MATLILTAVGTAVGGPLGGAIGAILGQRADAAIFAPKAGSGPRLGDLAVQTSTYGTQIPKIFGTMRVAGTVIWATDLKEEKSTSGGGKGRPKTTSYSYSASFAVALSGRPARAVRRIWADGKLLRGTGGDFKTATGFRFHPGDEDQGLDPLIAAAEGIGSAPAYRGLAYAVFEDMQLADYGNRIPSLTFEIEADPGPVAIGAIAAELSGGGLTDGGTPALAGYAASGESVRGAVETLAEVYPLSLRDDGAALSIVMTVPEMATIASDEQGASAEGEEGRSEFARRGTAAGEVGIVYYDPARDYQTGLQRARLGGTGEAAAETSALPAALGAEAAKALAEYRLAALQAGRGTGKIGLGWRRSDLRPGDRLRLDGQGGTWRVGKWLLEKMVLRLDLVRVPGRELAAAASASPGRPVTEPDLPFGPTTALLLDLPLHDGDLPGRPRLFALAAGAGAGWRRAELMTSHDGGASWQAAGGSAPGAVIGTALGVLPPGGSALIDTKNSIEIELLNDEMWLEGRSDDALVAGANLAAMGDELIQFGVAEPLGDRRFRLSRLLRGRRGTEWAASSHEAGEAFALIDPASMMAVEPPLAALGGEARLLAQGPGDEESVTTSRPISGEALRPPSPVHLTAERLANGDIAINWTRRSRSGWAWIDGLDAPLGEEREAYSLTIRSGGATRSVSVDRPSWVYSAADQLGDGAAGPFTINVAQIGTWAPSHPAEIGFEQEEI